MRLLLLIFLLSCNRQNNFVPEKKSDTLLLKDEAQAYMAMESEDSTQTTSSPAGMPYRGTIDVKNLDRDSLMQFAESLVNTPYVYGSTDPKKGFDCSGFITYVFNHFGVAVPRSSADFINEGRTVPRNQARRGDIILFTDPDFENTASQTPGHMGLITANNRDTISFIHSTSGKAMAVVVTAMNDHYNKRFLRVARIFE